MPYTNPDDARTARQRRYDTRFAHRLCVWCGRKRYSAGVLCARCRKTPQDNQAARSEASAPAREPVAPWWDQWWLTGAEPHQDNLWP